MIELHGELRPPETGTATPDEVASQAARITASVPATDRWLASLGAMHGTNVQAGAERLLRSIQTPRFELAVTTSESSVAIAFRRSARRIVPAYLRRDSARLELSLQNLSLIAPFERDGPRRLLAARLEAIDPRAFRWSDLPGGMPTLELSACTAERTAQGVALLLDDVLARALGVLVRPPRPLAIAG